MIIPDAEIRKRIANDHLLKGHKDENIKNCGYTLRIGKVFEPESGDLVVLKGNQGDRGAVVWEIGPTETLVVMTKETVKVPPDLCGVYAPLHRLAKQGVLLLNSSIVEPGYEGPLSCFLVNFSSARVFLTENQDITKITFHQLSAAPTQPVTKNISAVEYQNSLAQDAKRYTKSFMDVSEIAEKANKKAQEGIRGAIVLGGGLVAFLLLWSSLEPLFSRWLWERQGFPVSQAQRIEYMALLKDLESANSTFAHLKEQQELSAENEKLRKEVEQLRISLENLQKKVGN